MSDSKVDSKESPKEKKEEVQDKKKLGDLLKKVVNKGVSVAFTNETSLKDALTDLSLPKEIAQAILENAKSSKDDFVGGVKNELKGYLSKIDLTKEIDRVLQDYDLDIKAKISFNKKDKNSK